VAERLNAPDSKSGSAVSVDGGSNPPLSVEAVLSAFLPGFLSGIV